ncbi:GTP cyclohydrolase II [Helicobacter monodelphidis]|uniref:GTP cyclohydrolase II n=1 Tax=Helicobacter sp. 15-1451 TaxID=2004995 RepID=UPI000DCD842C|nr:GTP cyclohydrolase II [Helicobacter sp. 15-1451]RAX58381.1 GTP cyclohydrolase II [Helicobacter sp. 15-1451]
MNLSKIASLPTRWGKFSVQVFANGHKEHFVIFSQPLPDNPLVRIHSECLTGDVFSSMKCDCGNELDLSMQRIAKEGGMLIYLRQEGRGIGLLNKINAYALQDKGMDTVEANLSLGFKEDERDYQCLERIFQEFGLQSIRLLTNNPRKIEAIQPYVKQIVREEIIAPSNDYNAHYLKVKKEKLGHLL